TPFCFYTAEDYKHLPDPPPLPPDPGRVDPSRRADGPYGEIQWPLYWVFGTELPRVVVNEALAEIQQNDPDRAYTDSVRVFVELHNPFPRAVPRDAYQPHSFPVPLQMGAGPAAYAPYRVVVGVKSPVQGQPASAAVLPGPDNDNVLGNPDLAVVRGAPAPLPPAAPRPHPPRPGAAAPPPSRGLPPPSLPAHGPDGGALPQGFLLLGPPEPAPDPFAAYDPFRAPNSAAIPDPTPVLRT